MSDGDSDDSSTSQTKGDGNHQSVELNNLTILRDVLSATILNDIARASRAPVSKHARKRKITLRKDATAGPTQASFNHQESIAPNYEAAAEDLAEFIEYLASELFASLPDALRSFDQDSDETDQRTKTQYAVPLESFMLAALMKPVPPDVLEGISTCILGSESLQVTENAQTRRILERALEDYCEAVNPVTTSLATAATESVPHKVKLPPRPVDSGCELCERDYIPLTAHHLIPRSAHAKAIKRGWHSPEACTMSIAWLCRACHSFVHGLASNEELAQHLYAVETLQEREDVQRWVGWVSRVRWKAR